MLGVLSLVLRALFTVWIWVQVLGFRVSVGTICGYVGLGAQQLWASGASLIIKEVCLTLVFGDVCA